MKQTFALIVALFFYSPLAAQLAPGSIAPDFTVSDLKGNEWTLYELLDEGKSVILDISATWCPPCWGFHTTGVMDELYEAYGPDGTDELMVMTIEGEASTDVECLYGPDSCNFISLGDWTAGTSYPIINFDDITDLYEVDFFPTIYHVCPNRVLTEIGPQTADVIYAATTNCVEAFGDFNAAILSYNAFEGAFCQSQTISPAISVQNLGYEALTSMNMELQVNGVSMETLEWTGSLQTFQIEEVVFSEFTTSTNAEIEISILNINGMEDEDQQNNSIHAILSNSEQVSENILSLELLTDERPEETYWELTNAEGLVFYSGGNAGLVGGSENGTYESNTVYNQTLTLPDAGCYKFRIIDSEDNGLCCNFGQGFFRLNDSNGNVILEGQDFGSEIDFPFEVIDVSQAVGINAAIIAYNGVSGALCGAANFSPELSILNLGTESINSIAIDVLSNGALIDEHIWTGSIDAGTVGSVVLDPLLINETTEILFVLKEVNNTCLLYTSPSPRDATLSRMPSSA